MSTRIQHDFSFQAATFIENSFQLNWYDVSLGIDINTDSIREQRIAMKRIAFFMVECLDSCVFVHADQREAIDKLTACGIKVCTLPEDPYDQIINVALFLKLNAITEEKISILDISLQSKLGAGITFLYDIEEPIGPLEADGWWNSIDIRISDVKPKKSKADKIVELFNYKAFDWSDVDLAWKEKPAVESSTIQLDT